MGLYRVGGFLLTIEETVVLGSRVCGRHLNDFGEAFLALDKAVVRHGGLLRATRDNKIIIITKQSKYRRGNGDDNVAPMYEGQREARARLLQQQQGAWAMQIHCHCTEIDAGLLNPKFATRLHRLNIW